MIEYKLITVEEITTKYYHIPSELCDKKTESELYAYAVASHHVERWLSDEDYDVRVTDIQVVEDDIQNFTDAYSNKLPLWKEPDEDNLLPKFYNQSEGE